MFGDRIQDRGRGLGCEEGPDQEHGLNPVQARVQSVRSDSYLKTFYLTITSSWTPSLPRGTRKRSPLERSDSIRSIGFGNDLQRRFEG
jgi:hypothetical protein